MWIIADSRNVGALEVFDVLKSLDHKKNSLYMMFVLEVEFTTEVSRSKLTVTFTLPLSLSSRQSLFDFCI